MMEHVGYFAYGSNLNKSQMQERVGAWHSSKRARLIGYEFVSNVKSKRWDCNTSNVRVGNENDVVYGVVYFITREQLDQMTSFEGIDPRYVDVTDEDENVIHNVAVYYWDSEHPSEIPSKAYMDTVIEGIIEHKYSESVITKVKKSFKRL